MTEQSSRLTSPFSAVGNPAIKHGGNHFAFIAISREDVLHLNTIQVYRYTLRLGSMRSPGSSSRTSGAYTSNKKPRYLRGSLFLCLPDIALSLLHWPSADSRLTPIQVHTSAIWSGL
jgi:hypothetical protein